LGEEGSDHCEKETQKAKEEVCGALAVRNTQTIHFEMVEHAASEAYLNSQDCLWYE
jgi:hypothetical protein